MSIHEAIEKHMEKVSIITPCHNANNFIETTYDCLISQTHTVWEWIVVDDCSSDNSWETLTKIAKADSRVKILRNKLNSGAADTRNRCLENAEGEYIAFLDCDDTWDKNKLQIQLSFMKKTHSEFSYHNYYMINESGEKLKEVVIRDKVSLDELLKNNPFATSSIMIHSKIIFEHKVKFPSHLRRRQDYLFWYESLKICKVAYNAGETLSSYRVFSDNSLSANKKKMALIQWNLYRNEFRLGLFKSLYYFFHYAVHGIKKYFL